jgi:hypothetical protein
VLDEWKDGREIQDRIAATKGQGGPRPMAGAGGEGIWASREVEHVEEDVGGEVEFTGGVAYVERFASRGQQEVAAEGDEDVDP